MGLRLQWGVKEIFWQLQLLLTTILAFLPSIFLMGKWSIYRHIPIVVSMALIISLFEATVLLPFHLTHGKGKTPRNILWKNLMFYKFSLEVSLRYRMITLGIFCLCLIGTVTFFKKNGSFVLFQEMMWTSSILWPNSLLVRL